MASGFLVPGRGDLDALFLARASAARANVGYMASGVDIAQRYEPIGGGTPIAATGFRSGGTDLANLFRSISQPLGPTAQVQTATYNRPISPCSISFNSDGTVTKSSATSGPTYSWLTGGLASQCSLRVTPTVSSFDSGLVNTWLPLSSSRLYSKGAAAGLQTCAGLFEIRSDVSGLVIASGTITLQCDVT